MSANIFDGLTHIRAKFSITFQRHPRLFSLGIGVFAWLLSILLYFSWVMMIPEYRFRWNDFLKLCANPFCRDLYEPILTYRITVPVFAYLFHLPDWGALSLQYVATILALAVIFYFLAKNADTETGLLFTLGVSLTALTQWVNWFPGIPDSVTHLAAIICILPVPTYFLPPLIILGAFNDEKMMLALPFIFIWRIFHPAENTETRSWCLKNIAGVAGGVALWIALRYLLAKGYIGPGIRTPPLYSTFIDTLANFTPFYSNWPHWFWNVFLSFRALWALPLLVLVACPLRMLERFAYFGSWILVVLSSILVVDVSRSIGFGYIGMILAVLYLKNRFSSQIIKYMLTGVLFIQIFTPSGFYQFDNFTWFSPPLYKFFRELFFPM